MPAIVSDPVHLDTSPLQGSGVCVSSNSLLSTEVADELFLSILGPT